MNSNEILKADFLDILFDCRNKSYGAYALRKNYQLRLEIALVISLGVAAILLLLIRPNHYSKSVYTAPEGGVVVKYLDVSKDEKKIVLPKPKAAIHQAHVAEENFTRPVITENNMVKNTMADQKTLITALISDHRNEGPAITGPVTPLVAEHCTGGNAREENHPAPDPELTQREPEFPGGTKAWLAFLTRILQVPSELEAGEKKTVLMRFLVSADGEVTAFEEFQSGGRNYDNEVIRVLKKMPRWKPAIQNGQPVSRSFTQPVRFLGLSE